MILFRADEIWLQLSRYKIFVQIEVSNPIKMRSMFFSFIFRMPFTTKDDLKIMQPENFIRKGLQKSAYQMVACFENFLNSKQD